MVSQGVPAVDVSQIRPSQDVSGNADRLARHDLFLLRLEAARRRRRLLRAVPRQRAMQLDRLSG
jgi:hypothetical protein